MKFASLDDGTPDGRLLIVSRDLSRAFPSRAAATLAEALVTWATAEPLLNDEYDALNTKTTIGDPLVWENLAAALPRSYQFLDASAFLAHNHILAQAWGFEKRTEADPPLMYQGLSDRIYPAHGPIPFGSIEDEIDLEAEFAVITDRVAVGTTKDDALAYIRLIVLLNDWSLRAYGPGEMQAGFGFIHAKPPSALSAIAVTPDELASEWSDGKITLPVHIARNGEAFGSPHGGEMSYSFGALIAHAAHTRALCAGTIIGSGTVSNASAATTGSGCIAERRALDTIAGLSPTPYLSFGENVTLDCRFDDGQTVFGVMSHTIAELPR